GSAEDSNEAAIVRVVWREFQKRVKIPMALIIERAEASAVGREAWKEARATSDFSIFQPHLEKQFDIAVRIAEALGYDANPYDALVDQFEPGLTYDLINEEFSALKPRLKALIDGIAANADAVDRSVLHRHYPAEDQIAFSRRLAEAVGFDFNHGRLDLSTHPFTGGTSYLDVRLTTRVEEDYLPACMMATLHEAGHGIHSQQLDPELYRLPFRYGLATAESQSRFYENIIGRSRAFWQHFYPLLQETFPQLEDTDLETFYRAINKSEPSLIRVEADEVTYGMHIMLRFELENEVINERLAVADLPEAWNDRMESYLGIVPPNDAQGVLQDIHWSQGGIGYFPDYLLGSIFSSQLWDTLKADRPAVEDEIAEGTIGPGTGCLAEKIQRHGGKYTFPELAERATGQPFTAEPYIAYLESKFGAIYAL
ncbi:MAG: carboxypeptidase M32, partial [Anaerolineae bacterium]